MKSMTIDEIARAIKATVIQGSVDTICSGVSTDTRNIGPGELFIALIGEKFDAHDFLDKAIAGGASAIVISREVDIDNRDIPVLLTDNTTTTLQNLANYNRKQFAVPVIGITGSNGKTSTKDMVAAVLSQKFKTLKTMANFNNEIGLPLTLLKLDETYGAAVVEMGMRGPGEIDELARIAEPTGAVITIIGESHLELLGSVENIARAKGEILDYITEDKFALLNGDDRWQREMAGRAKGKVVFYGLGSNVGVKGYDIEIKTNGTYFNVKTSAGSKQMFIPVVGEHNVLNALAAIGVGLELGLSLDEIANGLKTTDMTAMRLEILEADNYTIINDAYNASPSSMTAALKTLKSLAGKGRSIAVLGNMFELGERTLSGHEDVGQEVARLGLDYLITVGEYASHIASGANSNELNKTNIYKCEDNIKAIGKLKEIISPGDTVLVKGSRGMKMEEIVQAIQ